MNTSLGGKLVWRLVSGEFEWWKKVIVSKYFRAPRILFLDMPLPNKKGSPLWKLIKYVAPLIQENLSWLSGNGASINV